jgi:hypothetical protein
MLRLHRNISINTLYSVQRIMAILNNRQNGLMLVEKLPWRFLSETTSLYNMLERKCYFFLENC